MPTPDRRPRMVTFIVAIAVLIAAPLAVVASENFTDVSDSNVHSADIDWLADNGVTLGCNPPDNDEFCPEDAVLRQQMASFMRRLAENQVVDAATAVDAQNATTADSAASADTAASADDAAALGGESPDAYRTIHNGDACDFGDCVDNTGFQILKQAEVTVDAPAAGTLAVSASATGFDGGLSQVWVAINRTDNDGCGTWAFAPAQAVKGSYSADTTEASEAYAIASSTAVNVPAGTHQVALCTFQSVAGEVAGAGLQTSWSQEGSGLALSAEEFGAGELSTIESIIEANS